MPVKTEYKNVYNKINHLYENTFNADDTSLSFTAKEEIVIPAGSKVRVRMWTDENKEAYLAKVEGDNANSPVATLETATAEAIAEFKASKSGGVKAAAPSKRAAAASRF